MIDNSLINYFLQTTSYYTYIIINCFIQYQLSLLYINDQSSVTLPAYMNNMPYGLTLDKYIHKSKCLDYTYPSYSAYYRKLIICLIKSFLPSLDLNLSHELFAFKLFFVLKAIFNAIFLA